MASRADYRPKPFPNIDIQHPDHFLFLFFWILVSHLSAPESPPGVPLLAEPLHEAEPLCDEAQFVLREQHVGRHLDVRRARLPRGRQAAVWGRPHRHAIFSQSRAGGDIYMVRGLWIIWCIVKQMGSLYWGFYTFKRGGHVFSESMACKKIQSLWKN